MIHNAEQMPRFQFTGDIELRMV